MNTATTIRKQFITDLQGRQIGVILPIEDYILIEPILRRHEENGRGLTLEEENLRKMEQAARDPLFLADLYEVMNDFRYVDAEWWERDQ